MALAASGASAVNLTIDRLNEARNLGLNDPAYYSKIVPGVLPIIGPHVDVDIRRWGADFLAEVFASPVVPVEDKQNLALQSLQHLKHYLEALDQDFAVLKSTIQALCNIYPLIFRYTVSTSDSADWKYWHMLIEAKSNILRRMDTAAPGLRAVCIKFVQQVVLTQTPGVVPDPRRPDPNEISLALVPRDHKLLAASKLEAEASGLLDRILGILQEDDNAALPVTATLNSLGSLIRSRATISNKVINAVLQFNPFKLIGEPLTPLVRVNMRSMERTTRSLLSNILKRNPQQHQGARIQAYLERLAQLRLTAYDSNAHRKRPLPTQSAEPALQVKRARLEAAPTHSMIDTDMSTATFPSSGPVSYAQIYTLTKDPGTRSFNVKMIPSDVISRIIVPVLQSIDRTHLDSALNVVRARYMAMHQQEGGDTSRTTVPSSEGAIVKESGEEEGEDDYEPDFEPSVESAEQVDNRVNMDVSEEYAVQPVVLGPFELATPPPLSQEAITRLHRQTLAHFFLNASANTLKGASAVQDADAIGLDRLASVTYIERSGLRIPLGLDSGSKTILTTKTGYSNEFRQQMLQYILDDWRRRIDLAISWLTEEWESDREADRVQRRRPKVNGKADRPHLSKPQTPNYDQWINKFMDDISAFIGNDASEAKILIRFLSEVPVVSSDIIARVKSLALDPERLSLTITALRFLVMFRPAVREMALDAIEDMWRHYDGAQKIALKDLSRWRPGVIDAKAALTESGPGLEIKTEG